MISAKKIQLFKQLKGSDDVYLRVNRDSPDLIDSDWYLLRDLISELYLVRMGRASKDFESSILKRLTQNCDNLETVKAVLELEKYLNTNC